jgi:hypothetical protein
MISRLDRDIGVLIDNCLGFLYSIDLRHDMRREIGRIEAALYDMVYLGRTPAGCEFKENLFRTRILPLMKRLAPAGYYFGIDPDHAGLLGYWQPPLDETDGQSHDPLGAVGDRPTETAVSSAADGSEFHSRQIS